MPANRQRNIVRRAARRLQRLLTRERELWSEGYARVAGVDEVGVGPLAGPVVAAAVIFPEGLGLLGVDDSKSLSAPQRDALAEQIRSSSLAWAVGEVPPEEVDRLNVYWASIEAMRRALAALALPPDYVLVDGRLIPSLAAPQQRCVKGDARHHAIAAASILAKTARDALMVRLDATYPGYGFAAHKGYATEEHRLALRRLGPSPIHRRSFTLVSQPGLFDALHL